MRLLLDKNAVLIHTKKRDKLLATIPTGQPVTVEGKRCVAVPYRMEEVKVLNNLGLEVPSPIVHRYTWPRSNNIPKPFQAQIHTAAMLTLNNRASCSTHWALVSPSPPCGRTIICAIVAWLRSSSSSVR